MRIIVYPHELSVGGSQLNAVELAGAVRDRGHEVAVFGVPGPLRAHIESLGLELIEAREPRRRPSPGIAGHLAQVVRAEGVDLVHGYEWPPALEAYYGPRLLLGVPTVCTILSMGIAPFLPPSVPLIVGTRLLQRLAGRRHGRVELIEPPVDTVANHPRVRSDGLWAGMGIVPDRPTIVVVSRLAVDLKLEGLRLAIAAVGRLARRLPVRLLIVGDGPARGQLTADAARVNTTCRNGTVVLAGELLDPRPAYAAADVVLGMGGSVLRGLAFAKPAIVLGEDGFSEILAPDTAGQFLWHGFYGLGEGQLGPERLERQLHTLLTDPDLRLRLGRFARDLVCDRFSLKGAAQSLEGIYRSALDDTTTRRGAITEAAVTGAEVVRYKLARRRARRSGTMATDDFNARPVLEPVPADQRPLAEPTGERR